MLQLGLVLGYSGRDFTIDIDLIQEAEALGYRSIWTSEAYGSDAVTPAAWILAQTERMTVGTALMQMPARTPACAAMTAMTLQALSGGRFVLGVGPSGPQVIEGWHGVAYGKPHERLREYVSIVRRIVAREEPVVHEGMHYALPYRGPDATGLGKPLKSIIHARHPLPIYTGSVSPAGLRLAGEITDGLFPLFMMPERAHVYRDPLVEGFRRGGHGETREGFAIAPFVDVKIDEDHARALLTVKQSLALYVGGMGARGRNFYNDYAKQVGLRRGRRDHPGPVPLRRQAGRGDGRARRVRRRHRPGRAEGAYQGAAGGVEDGGGRGVCNGALACRRRAGGNLLPRRGVAVATAPLGGGAGGAP